MPSINRQVGFVAAFTALSWLGGYVHNLIELPQLTILSPENSIVALISIILLVAWWLLPFKRITAILLLIWGLLHLIGGAIITVIPFSFLPFYPEQTLRHYLAHIIYGLAQLPLIAMMVWHIRYSSQGGSES